MRLILLILAPVPRAALITRKPSAVGRPRDEVRDRFVGVEFPVSHGLALFHTIRHARNNQTYTHKVRASVSESHAQRRGSARIHSLARRACIRFQLLAINSQTLSVPPISITQGATLVFVDDAFRRLCRTTAN